MLQIDSYTIWEESWVLDYRWKIDGASCLVEILWLSALRIMTTMVTAQTCLNRMQRVLNWGFNLMKKSKKSHTKKMKNSWVQILNLIPVTIIWKWQWTFEKLHESPNEKLETSGVVESLASEDAPGQLETPKESPKFTKVSFSKFLWSSPFDTLLLSRKLSGIWP